MDSRSDGPLKAALSFSCFAKIPAFCLFHSYRENVEVRPGRHFGWAYPSLCLFRRKRLKEQLTQPVWVRHAFAIGLQRFYRRVNAQVAVVTLLVLPAFMPVNSRLDSRILGPE